MYRTLTATLTLAVVNALSPMLAAQEPPAKALTAMDVLEWLPTDTETVIAANGPFTLGEKVDKKTPESVKLMNMLREHVCWCGEGEPLKDFLSTLDVSVAMEGARNFRSPSGLGGYLYNGCHIIVSKTKHTQTLKTLLQPHDTTVDTIAGCEVFSITKKIERDLQTLYYVQPRPNVLIYATDKQYLNETLTRMAKPGEGRAMPDTLGEWKYVDVKSHVWALRPYREGQTSFRDIPGFDAARSIIFNYSLTQPEKKAQPVLTCSGDAKAMKESMRELGQNSSLRIDFRVQREGPNVARIMPRLNRTPQSGDIFMLLLSCCLGHLCNI